jgi:hypothetical protein
MKRIIWRLRLKRNIWRLMLKKNAWRLKLKRNAWRLRLKRNVWRLRQKRNAWRLRLKGNARKLMNPKKQCLEANLSPMYDVVNNFLEGGQLTVVLGNDGNFDLALEEAQKNSNGSG